MPARSRHCNGEWTQGMPLGRRSREGLGKLWARARRTAWLKIAVLPTSDGEEITVSLIWNYPDKWCCFAELTPGHRPGVSSYICCRNPPCCHGSREFLINVILLTPSCLRVDYDPRLFIIPEFILNSVDINQSRICCCASWWPSADCARDRQGHSYRPKVLAASQVFSCQYIVL